jgi:hypothetical protein
MSYFNTSVVFIDKEGNLSYGCWGHDDDEGNFIPDDPTVDPDAINPL